MSENPNATPGEARNLPGGSSPAAGIRFLWPLRVVLSVCLGVIGYWGWAAWQRQAELERLHR